MAARAVVGLCEVLETPFESEKHEPKAKKVQG